MSLDYCCWLNLAQSVKKLRFAIQTAATQRFLLCLSSIKKSQLTSVLQRQNLSYSLSLLRIMSDFSSQHTVCVCVYMCVYMCVCKILKQKYFFKTKNIFLKKIFFFICNNLKTKALQRFRTIFLYSTCTPADITWNKYVQMWYSRGRCCATKVCYIWLCEHDMDHIHFNMWTLHDVSIWRLFIHSRLVAITPTYHRRHKLRLKWKATMVPRPWQLTMLVHGLFLSSAATLSRQLVHHVRRHHVTTMDIRHAAMIWSITCRLRFLLAIISP